MTESRIRPILYGLILIAAIFASMGRLVRADFTNWDDPHTIVGNLWLKPATMHSLAKIWTSERGHLYIPMTYSTWWVLAKCTYPSEPAREIVQSAAVFHACNLALHALATVTLFALLRRLFGENWFAFAGAMIFAVHPLQVESIGWVSGTKDVLCGLLSIVALWQYILFAQRATVHNYVIAFIAIALAILAKPVAVVVPALAATIDLLMLRRRVIDVLRAIVPMFALSLAGFIEARWLQRADGLTTIVSIPLRLPVALDSLGFYLHKLVLPTQLAFDYGRTPRQVVDSGAIRYSWIVPALGLIWIALARKKFPAIVAGAIVFGIALLPMLGFTPFDFQQYSTVADHYMYLPMIGVAVAVAAVVSQVPRGISIPIVCAVAVTLATVSFAQTKYWMNTYALMNRALDVNPNSWVAYTQLGAAYSEDGDFDRALAASQQALKMRPDNSDAYINIGAIELQRGNPLRAAQALEAAIRIRPSSEAHTNLANAYGQLGRFGDAITEFERALALDPANEKARAMLSKTRAYLKAKTSSEVTNPATQVTPPP